MLMVCNIRCYFIIIDQCCEGYNHKYVSKGMIYAQDVASLRDISIPKIAFANPKEEVNNSFIILKQWM